MFTTASFFLLGLIFGYFSGNLFATSFAVKIHWLLDISGAIDAQSTSSYAPLRGFLAGRWLFGTSFSSTLSTSLASTSMTGSLDLKATLNFTATALRPLMTLSYSTHRSDTSFISATAMSMTRRLRCLNS